jgi:hypothetical protein
MCQGCHRYFPSAEERAETRAMFRQIRHVLLVVAELHARGYELARICPFTVDTAGGGDWQCIIAPAAKVSPAHGARLDERTDWWDGPRPLGRDFPYYFGRCWRGEQPYFDTAEALIRAHPRLAREGLGRDPEYAEWYRDMLQRTEPDGVVYARGYLDSDKDEPLNGMRVLTPDGERDVLVPLPPPGHAPRPG